MRYYAQGWISFECPEGKDPEEWLRNITLTAVAGTPAEWDYVIVFDGDTIEEEEGYADTDGCDPAGNDGG